eukprot:gene4996-8594_t
MFSFTDGVWIKEKNSDSPIKLSSISVASFNVLHDLERKHITLPIQRYQNQIEIFQKEDFDIIGLCEVTQTYLDLIKSDKWIQNTYLISHLSAEEFHEHGCILLSKIPFNSLNNAKVETLERSVAIGELKVNDEESIYICMAHLIAFQRNYSERKFQLEKLYELLDIKGATTIIIGDLNFHHKMEDKFIQKEYLDVWKEIHDEDDEGFTYDPMKNSMIYEKLPIAFEYRQMRLDRILLKGDKLTPKSIEIFANESVFQQKEKEKSIDFLYYIRWPLRSVTSTIVDWTFYSNLWRSPEEYLFPSDHFGLKAKFEINK